VLPVLLFPRCLLLLLRCQDCALMLVALLAAGKRHHKGA
jgi:hypothetical protein